MRLIIHHVTIKGILYFVFQTLANPNNFVPIAARFVEFFQITESFTICAVNCLMTMMATAMTTKKTSFRSGQAALQNASFQNSATQADV